MWLRIMCRGTAHGSLPQHSRLAKDTVHPGFVRLGLYSWYNRWQVVYGTGVIRIESMSDALPAQWPAAGRICIGL